MPKTSITIIDDTDHRFIYNGNWTQHDDEHEYGRSSHFAHGKATAVLKFRGSSIAVYGTIMSSQVSQAGSASQFALDRNTAVNFNARPDAQDRYRVLFYQRDNLSAGDHVFVVRHVAMNDMFLLDYVEIGSTEKSIPIGTLVAAILTSVLGTLLLVLVIVFYRRRKYYGLGNRLQSQDSFSLVEDQSDSNVNVAQVQCTHITPFTITPPASEGYNDNAQLPRSTIVPAKLLHIPSADNMPSTSFASTSSSNESTTLSTPHHVDTDCINYSPPPYRLDDIPRTSTPR
ncbi:hypothetical protein CVT24_001699 [Panaeolus cyanescens]|uniref:Uncharacterized protein n=1 Tax=Panaeolus cyanescens TaxID=181874 RepID=A0A409YFL3_9AGAR|nr:hypothetical protein CVT24_001699 [Panaeolus cyanescens]